MSAQERAHMPDPPVIGKVTNAMPPFSPPLCSGHSRNPRTARTLAGIASCKAIRTLVDGCDLVSGQPQGVRRVARRESIGMNHLVACDVADDRRRGRVAKVLAGYGTRIHIVQTCKDSHGSSRALGRGTPLAGAIDQVPRPRFRKLSLPIPLFECPVSVHHRIRTPDPELGFSTCSRFLMVEGQSHSPQECQESIQ